MTNYAKKEAHIIKKIQKEFDRLEKTLQVMNENDNKTRYYFEQKSALHRIKKIIHEEVKLDDLYLSEAEYAEKKELDWTFKQSKVLSKIDDKTDALEATLAEISDAEDPSKIKSAALQRKVIREIKDILKEEDQLDI